MSSYTWLPGIGTVGSSHGILDRTLYVSTTGNDTTGTGTQAAPWATIDKARSVIRAGNFNDTSNTTVIVGDGAYYDTDVTFTDADAGTDGHFVQYQSATVGGARLIGGHLATGWELHSGSIYKLAVASPVYSLYENGVRAIAARIPVLNPGVDYPCAFAPYYQTAGVIDSYTVLQYDPLDFDPATWTLADVRLFCWSVVLLPQTAWFTDTHGATNLNTTTKRFTLDHDGMKFKAAITGATARYFVQGDLSMLTSAGTFVYSDGFLYYWARDGIAPSQEIVIPSTKSILSLTGASAGARVSNLRFHGFSLECSDFDTWYRYGTDGLGVQPYDYFNTLTEFREGGFRLENCDNVVINSCHIKNQGFAGVFMQGCIQTCTVVNTWIENTGTDGISVNGLTPGLGDVSNGNMFSNVKVNNYGELDGGGTGIRLSQSSENVVCNWDISDGPRRAIWVHGAFELVDDDNYCYSNVVTLGRATDVCQDSGDAAAIGVSFLSAADNQPPPNPVNVFSEIIVTGVNAHPSMIDNAPNGCYADNRAGNQTWTNIQTTDIQSANLFFNQVGNVAQNITNCSFLNNGTADPSFNSALLSPDIGLTDEWPF